MRYRRLAKTMAINLLTFEGIVENGQVRLTDPIRLTEGAHVLVIVAQTEREKLARIYSPRLLNRSELRDFEMEELEQNDEV